MTEKVSDVCREVAYHAVWLENEYLRVMVLPELGGRIHRALDKTNGYDFVYYNHVVKPALVGLTGPWISGGIEFNWPQHHRPTTFSPVDYRVAEHDDGSVTVYVGETDKMYGTKGMAAISLYPGKAYLEIRGRLYNPTDLPQTFLWWANPAVPVNDHTYSVFPPDVNAVMDHGRRAVSTFPIATGEYYKCDYSAGWTSRATRTCRSRPPTWRPTRTLTLWATTTNPARPGCFMWRTTMWRRAKNSGPGATAISAAPGTAT